MFRFEEMTEYVLMAFRTPFEIKMYQNLDKKINVGSKGHMTPSDYGIWGEMSDLTVMSIKA